MSLLDVVLVALLALSAWGGYRRGAVLQVAGLVGLVVGFVVGALLAPTMSGLARSDLTRAAIALGTVLVLGALGDAVGSALGKKLHERAVGTRFKLPNAIGGSAISLAALILSVWFLGLNLASGPFPSVARSLQRSAVVRIVDATLPPPPVLSTQLGNVLNVLGFPDVFAGLPPLPADPVPQPTRGRAALAAREARDAVVLVAGPACGAILQGTGFAVGPELVLTNAHVIAGASPRVEWNGATYDATPVLFDEDLDAAVLRVPGLAARPLTLMGSEVDRGDGGAVLGFPGGRYAELRAGVRRSLAALSRDIYSREEIHRRLYELQVTVRHGNSGGPFVLPGRRAAGLVVGTSLANSHVGYAITSPQLVPLVERAERRTAEVGTGRCVR